MANARLDLEALRDGLADWLKQQVGGGDFDVYGYVGEAPALPALGIFPAADYVSYYQTFGPSNHADVQFDLRGACSYGAEDAQRMLDRMLSSGAGQTMSIIDPFVDDPTCGGLVESAYPSGGFVRPVGDENAGIFEAVVRLQIIVKREA